MQTLKTPNVYRQEKDLSEVTVGAGTSVGAITMAARQGVANQRVLINTDKQLIDTFGTPIPSSEDVGAYAGMEFLKESDSLYVVRATSGSEKYAGACISATVTTSASSNPCAGIQAQSTTELLIDAPDGNTDTAIYDLDNVSASVLSGAKLLVACKGPGVYGNNIGIKVFNGTISASPTLSANYDWANKYDNPEKVFKILVYVKETADTTFSSSQLQETFYVTREYLKDGSGAQLFVEDVINGKSNYIYVVDAGDGATGTAVAGNFYSTSAGDVMALAGGTDADVSTATNPYKTNRQQEEAWDLFVDKTKVSVNILIDTMVVPSTTPSVTTVAGQRLDCIACVQAGGVSATTLALVKSASPTIASMQSYSAIYAGWDKIYDSFNDRYVYIPKCVYGAAIMARTDRVANTWDAPAGTNRGVLPSVGQNVVFSDTDIGELYDVNINTSRLIRGTGNVLWGQKTAQKKKSALDRINVRRLLLYVENSVESSLLPFLFEPNNAKTRLRAWSMVDGFMKGVFAGGGVTKYEVVCDDTNNTAQTIDNNELVLDLYVQPTKTIEYIRLNVIVTRTGVSFSEIR